MPRPVKLVLVFVVSMASLSSAARAVNLDTNIHITQFEMQPTTGPEATSPAATQAGGNPNVSLFMRFCGQGLPIQSVDTTTKIVTTQAPHGITLAHTDVKIVGESASVNGLWSADPIVVNNTFDPNRFQLTTKLGPAPGDTFVAPAGYVQIAPWYGCVGTSTSFGERESRLRDFRLHLPPGFLGNPTALPACPEAVWVAGVCPDSTILGYSVTETITEGSSTTTPPLRVPSELYNIETMGLRPAVIGTRLLGSTPPGPFPIAITVRTTGDYGIDSALVKIPKNLGGPRALITQIDTVLCAKVPCKPTDPNDPHSVQAGVNARPFFRNPTSCGPKTPSLEATSWADNPVTDTKDAPQFTTTGCDGVPFDATAVVTPKETTQAGIAGSQQVTIDYGHNYADETIWQAALRKADVTLPDGMALSPGGGNGLEACSFDQFGVNAAGHQVNDDAPSCPAGAKIGDLTVQTPVLPGSLSGKVFFGPVTGPGRPTPDSPWKLFLYIQGAGLRIKLVGNVDISPTGQVHNVFADQPEVPFTRLDINLNGGDRAVLANPNDCSPHNGHVTLTGWNGKTKQSAPGVTATGCPTAVPFAPTIDEAGSNPDQGGANTTSHIVISRADGQDDIKNLKLSLPAGAVGSLAAVPECAIALAQAGSCPAESRVGTVNTTVGTGTSLLTTAGSLYLAEPSVPGDAATLALTVPARAGPIDLGQVVVLNRIMLRPSDTGVDAVTSDIPNIFGGVPLHVRKIEITVDRPGFFLNPTGCEPRALTAAFTGCTGQQSTSTMMLHGTGCDKLPFGPKLRLIAGAKGQNAQLEHPPLKAIVTQTPAEANIKSAQVILPDLLRPNSPEFNIPGGLCTDTQFDQGGCPKLSEVGSAQVTTPVLPFQLAGPVYVVQETGSILPKLYVVLRGRGLQVVLRARNSFQGIRTVNTFDNLPDVPQARFELNIGGGPNGILNNFYDACGVAAQHRKFDYTFTGQNGKVVKTNTMLEQEGCLSTSSARASIASRIVRVRRNGIAALRVRCLASTRCKGRVSLRAKGVQAAKSFSIGARKTQAVKLKLSKKALARVRKARRMRGRASVSVAGKSTRKSITLRAA
jgi:hypothetical protein